MPAEVIDIETWLMEKAIVAAVEEAVGTLEEHGPFHSAHEAYAVLLEEVDELWEAIRANDLNNAIEEATQVAAMALRFLTFAARQKHSQPLAPVPRSA